MTFSIFAIRNEQKYTEGFSRPTSFVSCIKFIQSLQRSLAANLRSIRMAQTFLVMG